MKIARHLLTFAAALLAAGCDVGSTVTVFSSPLPVPSAPAATVYPLPFKAGDDVLSRFDGTSYHPLFLKGVNLGVGVPGTQPGDLAATDEQYRRWFARMGELGVNSVRLYTLHQPRCYQALAAYNAAHLDKPIYLLQGVWIDDAEEGEDLIAGEPAWEAAMHDIVDAMHGRARVTETNGRASGDFTSDVSPWVAGYIVGREIQPSEVLASNAKHPEMTSYTGTAFKLASGSPLECSLARRMDHLAAFEKVKYGVQRPVSFASWPTLDPLRHPTEDPLASSEDVTQLDLATLQAVDAPGGFFLSYHAYPYYPDFMTQDPGYQQASDSQGPNSYMGYLRDLRAHYGHTPVVVAEFGTPSSWGDAHFGPAGLDHGGLDEQQQGKADARLLLDIHEAGAAGGLLFSWVDEWWKRTWIVDPLAFPRAHYPLWHNLCSPEQNFGLIAFDVADPAYAPWPGATAQGAVKGVTGASDAAFLYVRLALAQAPTAATPLTLGFDTYKAELGESKLPNGQITQHRCEFALILTGAEATVQVTRAYNTQGIWHGTSAMDQLFHTILTDGAPWDLVRWQNGAGHTAPAGPVFPDTFQDIGKLRVHAGAGWGTSLDAVAVDGGTVTIRLPWTLLNVTDPSAAMVLDRTKGQAAESAARTDGVALTVGLGADRLETGRYVLPTWSQVPATHEREKTSMGLFGAALQALP